MAEKTYSDADIIKLKKENEELKKTCESWREKYNEKIVELNKMDTKYYDIKCANKQLLEIVENLSYSLRDR